MSYFDDASLVMIPSGYKDQKVYSVKPIDGSGDLTFSRASNATRVNSSGLVEKVRTNEILQSNTFSDAAWTKTDSTVTSGQSGYDGTTNAWLLTKSAGSGRVEQNLSTLSSASNTLSVYVKANASTWCAIEYGTSYRYLNLSTGAVSSGGGGYIVQSIGNGWYRLSINNSSSSGVFRIYPAEADDIASSSGSIFIQAAQVETGDIATDPITTLGSAVSVGPVSGLPRLDYSGGASCPSLLLEPQRTNLMLYSEQFDNAYWTKSNSTITANNVTSPDGYSNADLITASGSGSVTHVLNRSVTTTSGSVYAFSVFAKKGTTDWIALRHDSGGTFNYFNLATGTKGATCDASATIENYGNGWYRLTVLHTATGSNGGEIYIATANGTISFETAGETLYIYGAQYELGAYSSSYLNTLSTAVTRVGDMVGKSSFPTSILNTTQAHSGYFELKPNAIETAAFQVLGFDDGSYTGYIKIYADTTGQHRLAIASGGSSGVSAWGIAGQYNKFAWSYDGAGNVKLFCNGVASVNYSITLVAMTVFGAGEKALQTNFTSQNIKQIVLFDSKLTDAQLTELTA